MQPPSAVKIMDNVKQTRYARSMINKPMVRYLDRTTPPHISTLILLAALPALSMNMFLPSIPAMADHFNVEYYVMQLSVSLYLAMTAVVQLLIGPLSDRYGRRPIIQLGGVIFIIATLGCILAPSAGIFLGFRILQAVIATGMALSRAVIRDMVPADQAASMIGYVTMGMSLSPMIGPFIGGVLDTYFGWQSTFWLLLVLGIMLLALSWADLGETSTTKSESFSAQFKQYPELLLSRRFWGYALSATFAAGSFFAYLGGAPFVGKELFHMDAIWLGFSFGAVSTGYMLGNFVSGRYSIRVGMNQMILLGTTITTLGVCCSLALFYLDWGSAAVFFGFMTTVGLGNGMTLPNANAGMLSVRPSLAGSASGLGGAMLVGGGAGLATLSGSLLSVESGIFPLLWLMVICSALSVVMIWYVIRRERAIL